jgi:hypothetical protein
MLLQVETRLRTDLGTDPGSKLRSVKAPWGERLTLFTFSLPDPHQERVVYTFMFHLVYTQDEKGLLVVDCGLRVSS